MANDRKTSEVPEDIDNSGQTLYAYKCPYKSFFMGGKEFKANDDGVIMMPYKSVKGLTPFESVPSVRSGK